MNRMKVLISLIVLTIVSSLIAVQSTNCFMYDVINIKALFSGAPVIIATLPPLLLSAITVLAFLGIIRTYLRPNSKKKLMKNYLIISIVLSGLGFITSLLAGIVVYKSLVNNNPFPGYSLLLMIVHLIILGSALYGLLFCLKKVEDDTEVVKVNFFHVLKTIGWFLFISMVYNRLGAFLAIPTYIYLRNLYLTFPFFLYLLVPVAIGVYKVLLLLGYIKDIKKKKIWSIVLLAVNVCLFIPVVIIGMLNTGAVSAVSFAMPLERISSMPVEIIIHFLTYTGVMVLLLVKAFKEKAAE